MLNNLYSPEEFYDFISKLTLPEVESAVSELRKLRIKEFPIQAPGEYKLDKILSGYSTVMAGLVFSEKPIALLLDNAFNIELKLRKKVISKEKPL